MVHKTGNVLNKVVKSIQPAVKQDLREIWMAPDLKAAERACDVFEKKYGAKHSGAVGTVGNSVLGGAGSISGGHCLCKPVAEDDGHLSFGGRPFPWRHLPVFFRAVQDEKQQLQRGLIIGEMPPGPHRPAQL